MIIVKGTISVCEITDLQRTISREIHYLSGHFYICTENYPNKFYGTRSEGYCKTVEKCMIIIS